MFQTIGASTPLAEEMHVQVVVGIGIVTVAQLVAYAVATVLDDVHQMVFLEQCQSPEHTRLIDRQNLILQFRQRHGATCSGHSLQHQGS